MSSHYVCSSMIHRFNLGSFPNPFENFGLVITNFSNRLVGFNNVLQSKFLFILFNAMNVIQVSVYNLIQLNL